MVIFEDFLENKGVSMHIPTTIAYSFGAFYLFFPAFNDMKTDVLATLSGEMALPRLVYATYLYFGIEQRSFIFDLFLKVLRPK